MINIHYLFFILNSHEKIGKEKEQFSLHFTQAASNLIEELRILAYDATQLDEDDMFTLQTGEDFRGVDILGNKESL